MRLFMKEEFLPSQESKRKRDRGKKEGRGGFSSFLSLCMHTRACRKGGRRRGDATCLSSLTFFSTMEFSVAKRSQKKEICKEREENRKEKNRECTSRDKDFLS